MQADRKKRYSSISAVARECGVSAMTVSRALREGAPIKTSTRNRILQAAARLGYHPTGRFGRPRHLAGKIRPAVVAIMGMGRETPTLFYSSLLVSIERELFRHHHDCIIRTYSGEYAQFLSLRESLPQSPAAGTLLIGYFPLEQLTALLSLVPRPILVDNPGDPGLECAYDSVSFDNVEAARLSVRHLLRAGRRRIALLKGFSTHYFSREIEQGYREILTQAGIAVDDKLILETDFTAENAYQAISVALKRGLALDAVFTNDEMACGVIRALHERHISIPSDIAVVGCDGLSVGLQIIPRLTTVILDYKKLGQIAVDRLLDKGKMSSPCRIKLVPVLEVRESTMVKPKGEGNVVS